MTSASSEREVHAQLAGVTRIYPAAGDHPPVTALGPIDLDASQG